MTCFESTVFDSCFCVSGNQERDDLTEVESCTNQTMQNALCCADVGYPGGDTSCQCARWGCDDDGGLCFCSFVEPGEDLPPTCGGGHENCCAHELFDGGRDSCACASFECGDGDIETFDDCARANFRCSDDEVPVDSCT